MVMWGLSPHAPSVLSVLYIAKSILLYRTKFRHLTTIFCAKWQNFGVRKNTYTNAGISTRFLMVSPAAMISLP